VTSGARLRKLLAAGQGWWLIDRKIPEDVRQTWVVVSEFFQHLCFNVSS
jgi:hypothetical protein